MKTLIIRSVSEDFTSTNNFKWSKKGIVKCPDWNPIMNCGNGLHGLRLNQNDPGVWYEDGKLLLLEVEENKIIDLGGKCKFPEANVLKVFDAMEELTNYLYEQKINIEGMYRRTQSTDLSVKWIGGTRSILTAGNSSTLTAGDHAVLKAGDYSMLVAEAQSILKAGEHSQLNAGSYSTLVAGPRSVLTAGNDSILVGGDACKLTAGSGSKLYGENSSILKAGNYSTLIASKYAMLTTGYGSKLTAEYGSELKAGKNSILTAGYCSKLSIDWEDQDKTIKTANAIVGENGILPNIPYRLNNKGEFVQA